MIRQISALLQTDRPFDKGSHEQQREHAARQSNETRDRRVDPCAEHDNAQPAAHRQKRNHTAHREYPQTGHMLAVIMVHVVVVIKIVIHVGIASVGVVETAHAKQQQNGLQQQYYRSGYGHAGKNLL